MHNAHIYIWSKWKPQTNDRTVICGILEQLASLAPTEMRKERTTERDLGWLAREPHLKPLHLRRPRSARAKGGKISFRELTRSSLSPYRYLSDVCDNDIHRPGVKSGDFTTRAPSVTSLSLYLSSRSTAVAVVVRSEKEVNARESVPLGKKLG